MGRPFPRHLLARLLARRVLLGLLSLLLVSIVVFAATQMLPGDAARAVVGRGGSPEHLEALRHQLHLDLPAITQYRLWLGGFLTGDAGISLVNGRPVIDAITVRLANSFTLLLLVVLIGIPLAIAAGITAAMRRNRPFDTAASMLALALAAIPEFVIGIALIVFFATVVLHWLPPVSMVRPGTSVFARPLNLVLPVATLIIAIFPYTFRMIRASMIDVLDSEYIEMATLKGLSRRRIVLLHALPNAIAPTIQAIALTCGYLAGGCVVVEYVFGFPGIGQGLVSAVLARDIPYIQCAVLILAAFYVAVNLLADLVAILVTPKLRSATS
ncbi:MAG TPA: ABC transporter permease [Dongiaceae bacterium]|nr:ABC transporter permease [Dongiaceae bacterium]